MTSSKKYGLVLPEKSKTRKPVFQSSRNVFGDDSESDGEANKKPVLLRPSDNINRRAKIAQQNALMEDPTVYQYDEIYDEMANKKVEKKEKKVDEKKPRYIENLMKSATKRKLENERRIERQIQKEREKEGDEFADKEVFVTSAYKKKLEEMRLEEEKEKREEYLESVGDVTKQRDLGGFYRHLYEQKMGSDENKMDSEENTKVKPSKKEAKSYSHVKAGSDVTVKENKLKEKGDISKKRNYRKRKTSDDNTRQLSDGEIEDSGDEINRVNLDDIRLSKKFKKSKENIDADSDFTIDESSDENEDDEKKEDDKEVITKESKIPLSDYDNEHKKVLKEVTETEHVPKSEPVVEVKPKVDIWKKRTVGEVFEQAVKRYYERKASRGV